MTDTTPDPALMEQCERDRAEQETVLETLVKQRDDAIRERDQARIEVDHLRGHIEARGITHTALVIQARADTLREVDITIRRWARSQKYDATNHLADGLTRKLQSSPTEQPEETNPECGQIDSYGPCSLPKGHEGCHNTTHETRSFPTEQPKEPA